MQRAVKTAETADTVQVLVAARTIGTGKVFDANDFRYDMWPKAVAAGQQVIVRKDKDDPRKDYIGYVARRDLFPGEPIGASAVYKSDSGSKLSVLLDPGMRAITINITAESAIAGLAVPGDRVDIILTADLSKLGGETRSGGASEFLRFVSETVLPNVKLLAIDQVVSRESTGKDKDAAKAVAGAVGKTATVAVTPEQAEKLILAGQMGKLSLILRSVAESADGRVGEYTTDVETSAVLSKLIGKSKAGKGGDGENKAAKSGRQDSGGASQVIINRGGERLAR